MGKIDFVWYNSSLPTIKWTLFLPGSAPYPFTPSTIWTPPSDQAHQSSKPSATSYGSHSSSSCVQENTAKTMRTPSSTPSYFNLSSSLWASTHTTLPPRPKKPSPNPTSPACSFPRKEKSSRSNPSGMTAPDTQSSVSGVNASPRGIYSTTWRHQQHPHFKCQVCQDTGTSQHCHDHRQHPSNNQGGRPSHRFHGCRHQRLLTPCRRGHFSPPGQGGSGHNPPRGEVAEQHNYLLPTYHHGELHSGIFSPHAPTRRLHARPARARRFLGPSRPNWPTGAQSQGVSGGLAQDQCGLGNLNITFLAHSRASILW